MKPAGYWPCRNEIINAHLSTPDDCHVDFIAVFSIGNTTAQRINEIAGKSAVCVLFQCPTH